MRWLLVALILWPIVLIADVPIPHPVKAFKGEKCVEPAGVMRRQHMNFLMHQRDDTVRRGIRGKKHSLRGCINCHAIPDKQAGGTRTVREFCSDCHNYAAIKITCFECHTNKVEDSATIPSSASLIQRTSNNEEHR